MTLQENIEQLSIGEMQADNFNDLVALALHQLVAIRLRSNPGLLEKAKSNLRNWLANTPDEKAWIEWEDILKTETLENILKTITSETEEGQRLRSSSPFAGIISDRERKAIIEVCEKAKPF